MANKSAPTVAIANGSSRTATETTLQALASGSTVHLIVRSAARVSRRLTEKPSPKLHIHELTNMFDPEQLKPILARNVDFLVLVFAHGPTEALTPVYTLNQDGAIAAVAAIRALTPAGQKPRIKVIQNATTVVNPRQTPTMKRIGKFMMPALMHDLQRASEYLQTQEVWGLEWSAMASGQIFETAQPEPDYVRRDGAQLVADPLADSIASWKSGARGGIRG